MSDPDDNIAAALFAAGALTGPERVAVNARLKR